VSRTSQPSQSITLHQRPSCCTPPCTKHPHTSHTLTMLQFRPDSENHTLLFTLAASSAAVELGLTAYLMIAGSHAGGVLYHSLFVLFATMLCFEQCFSFIVDRLFSSLMHFGPYCSSQHACYGLREAAWIYWLIYLAQFFGVSPRHLSGYHIAMPCHSRCLSPVLQGSAIGWIHNTRARKSCRAIPSHSRYIGRLLQCPWQMLILIQLHALHISRIPCMDGPRALRSNVSPRCHMDSKFTNWKGKSE
jgi:hypothetical protein